MKLSNQQKNTRLKGIALGTIAPIICLLGLGIYGYKVSRPIAIDSNGFAAAPHTFLGVMWVYIKDVDFYKYHVIICLSVNMILVWWFSKKKNDLFANGIIVPTAVYVVVVMVIKLLL